MMFFDKNNKLSEIFNFIFSALNLAARNPEHPFRIMSLATTKQQVPRIRYVVLRGMNSSGYLYFFTDFRTQKTEHIQANPEVALLFYDPKERVQLRIQGTALIHRNNSLAEEYWKTVPGDAKKAYNPLVPAGTVISHPQEAYAWPEDLKNTNFAVVEVIPSEMDILQLDGLNHIRANFLRKGGNWKMDWVAP